MKKRSCPLIGIGLAAALAMIIGCSDQAGTIPGMQSDASVVKTAGLPALSVEIMIKPGEEADPAPINLKAKGALPVAVLGTAEFDAETVDPLSADFSGASVLVRGRGKSLSSVKDVNEDGFPDIVLHFDMESLEPAGDAVREGPSSERSTSITMFSSARV